MGISIVFACSKTEVPKTPPAVVIQEEAIKFTTNLDTGTFNVIDTLPLTITVSSKIPAAGALYSILVNWTDSSKQIFKLDTSLTVSSLSLNIPGLKKIGSYSLSVTVTSKSTSTNTLNKSISVVNNPLGRFMGYKVASNARQLGFEYWYHGTGVMPDLITAIFQKPYNGRSKYGTFFNGVVCGDFNNDGLYDLYLGAEMGFQSRVFQNNTVTENNYVKCRLKGRLSNHNGVGTYIDYYLNGNANSISLEITPSPISSFIILIIFSFP